MIKKMMGSTEGFTIVEVVVVSVIVAILAAVAIPVYLGFQNDARQNAVEQLAQTAAAAADGYCRKTGAAPKTLADLNLFDVSDKYTVTIDSPKVHVEMIGHSNNFKDVLFIQ